MQIVLDSNVVISALIKDSKIREILTNIQIEFLFPEYIFVEIQKHRDEIIRKAEVAHNELQELLNVLLKKIRLVRNYEIEQYKEQAINIIKEIDIDDTLFIATALAFKDSTIWSDDKALKQQNKIKIMSTSEIIQLFNV